MIRIQTGFRFNLLAETLIRIQTEFCLMNLLAERDIDQNQPACRDIAPEGDNIKQSGQNLDQLTDLALELQKKTGVKLLWATCNLFAHPRYGTKANCLLSGDAFTAL